MKYGRIILWYMFFDSGEVLESEGRSCDDEKLLFGHPGYGEITLDPTELFAYFLIYGSFEEP